MRGSFTVAKVAVSQASYSYDQLYSYHIPSEIKAEVKPGMRVLVPFGKGNRRIIGFVARTYEESVYNEKVKPIISVVDSESLVNDEMMDIIFWLKENTFCTYYDAFKAAVPSGFAYVHKKHYSLVNTYIDESSLDEREMSVISFMRSTGSQREIDNFLDDRSNEQVFRAVQSLIDKGFIEVNDLFKRRVGDETVKMVRLTDEYLNGELSCELTPKQKKCAELLEDYECASVKEICYMTGCTQSIIKALADKGAVFTFDYQVMRGAIGDITDREDPDSIVLNEEQSAAFDGIASLMDADKSAGAVLYGITGSGKTSVFIKLIQRAVTAGKTAMLLVPEISLTPQMLTKFKRLFGEQIAVIHSSLSMGQRTDEFKRIRNGEARIVIGTRSAVFAPLSDIGVIIMDEEGEPSYKSDSAPRYHARDVAIQRCGHHNAVLVMASATPSLESFYYAKKGRFGLFELRHRFSEAKLPEVRIIDMQQEAADGNGGLLSRELIEGLGETLARREQAILLLNRRGHSTYISCMDCRQPISCPNCQLPLTYHKKNDRYMCHYCGYTMDNINRCPACGSDKLKVSGVGTQKVEDELARLFPKARLLRMDADTASSRYSYEKNFKAFEDHEYDIMLGTQMIAKGLDFPDVTLVGVVSLDKALFTGDYRSYERTFSLLTQVAGRCGRGIKPGKAYIQTFVPEHYVIELAAKQDYDEFFNEEAALRKTLTYPPYCDICVFGFSSPMESKAVQAAKWTTERIARYIRENEVSFPLRALGPSPCTLEVLNNRYRYRLILKSKNTKQFRDMIKTVLQDFYRNRDLSKVRIYADINGDVGL